ncbi:hypothetical protein AWC38_SpisGene25125 [Stylophora pistillata]|uniref:Uncharacterized protein n=1 Tax=Stylophora pistillata TaxID=50429 RepID=A0A2B4R0Q1_STYPI|nr:hypothetical protein AWC38_SpisGene25125 [Stylophora pistillata]
MHTEYRPRSRSGSTQEPEDEEIHDFDITAKNVLDDDMLSCLEEQEFPSITPSAATSDLACALEAANSLLEEWRVNKAPSNQNWEQRISNLNESWAGVRQKLFNSVLSTSGIHPERSMCCKCLKNPAVIHCCDCHMHRQLCGACDQSVHEILPFHDRSAFKSRFLKPIPPTVSVDHKGEWVSVDRHLPFSEMCLICPFCNICNMQRTGKEQLCSS